ncbi:MAG: phosphatidylcholine/phosphatidylserine synthase [Phycisphaeraceae bacterium]
MSPDSEHPKNSRRRRRGRRRQRIGTGMIRVLPSAFTLANLLCGFAAIFYASRMPGVDRLFPDTTPLTLAASLIFLGMLFDALDGRVARMTRQTSELGEQLDSMADMVTFGVAPAFLVIQMAGIGAPFFGLEGFDTFFDRGVLVIAATYVACCALRLARFNIEINLPGEADHLSFKGLPSPAAAGTVGALVLVHESLLVGMSLEFLDLAKAAVVAMLAIVLLTAIAMVSTMRYTHLLNRYVRGRAPFAYLATAVILMVPLLVFPQMTLAIAFTVYALSTPSSLLYAKLRNRTTPNVLATPLDEAPDSVDPALEYTTQADERA